MLSNCLAFTFAFAQLNSPTVLRYTRNQTHLAVVKTVELYLGATMTILILKEKQMQPQTQSTLDVIYENWRGYHEKLRDCLAPLTDEQLLLQPAAQMWDLVMRRSAFES